MDFEVLKSPHPSQRFSPSFFWHDNEHIIFSYCSNAIMIKANIWNNKQDPNKLLSYIRDTWVTGSFHRNKPGTSENIKASLTVWNLKHYLYLCVHMYMHTSILSFYHMIPGTESLFTHWKWILVSLVLILLSLYLDHVLWK